MLAGVNISLIVLLVGTTLLSILFDVKGPDSSNCPGHEPRPWVCPPRDKIPRSVALSTNCAALGPLPVYLSMVR